MLHEERLRAIDAFITLEKAIYAALADRLYFSSPRRFLADDTSYATWPLVMLLKFTFQHFRYTRHGHFCAISCHHL